MKTVTDIINTINELDPIHQINEKEFNSVLLIFGSLVTMLKNKRVNQTMLLSLILENEDYKSCFKQISEVDSDYELIYNLIKRFPVLGKSKIIKNKVTQLNKNVNRKRKRNI